MIPAQKRCPFSLRGVLVPESNARRTVLRTHLQFRPSIGSQEYLHGRSTRAWTPEITGAVRGVTYRAFITSSVFVFELRYSNFGLWHDSRFTFHDFCFPSASNFWTSRRKVSALLQLNTLPPPHNFDIPFVATKTSFVGLHVRWLPKMLARS